MDSAQHQGENIDLKAIFHKLLAKWWLFGLTVATALGLAYARVKTTPKTYEVQAVMLMGEEKRNSFGGGEDFLKGMSLLRSSGELEDKIAVLTSVNNITKTLKRLDFGISYYERTNFLTTERYEYPPFFITLDSVALQVTGVPIHVSVDTVNKTYRVTAEAENVQFYNVKEQIVPDGFTLDYRIDQTVPIGKPFLGENLAFTIDFPADRTYRPRSDYFFVINSLSSLAREWRGRTMVGPLSDESNIVLVTTAHEVVKKQQNFINKLMETYMEGELNKMQQKGRNTISFIEKQLGQVSDTLMQQQAEQERARRLSTVFNVGQTSDVLLNDRSRLEDQRSEWTRKRTYCQTILTKLRANEDFRNVPAPSSSGIDDPVLNSQVLELTRLAADLAVENLSTVRSNPKIAAMERRIRNLQGSLIATAEGLVQQADIAIDDINRRLGGLNYQFSQLASSEVALTSIESKLKPSENVYNYLMEKNYEARIAIASDQIDKSVVDEARMNGTGPVAPDRKMIFGGALVLGLLLPMGFILLRDFFNDRIAGLDELKRLSPIPVMSTIPSSKRKRVMPDEPKSLLAESFRTARINLQYLNPGAQKQVVGFTSSSSGEGKTFCALNLATVMAMSGKRTVLVDADMRRPRVAETLNLQEGRGLSTYLIGEASLEDILRRTDIERLDVISAGPIPPNPLELVETPRLAELFAELRARYDQVVVDASPMGLVSEYVVLMRHVDVTLYVVREGHTRRGQLRLINEMATEKKVRHLDLLLNDVKAGPGHGSGYGYYEK